MALGQPILTIETDFIEKGQEILARARRAETLSMKSPYVRSVIAEIETILHVSLVNETPLGLSTWHHSPGELQRSSDVVLDATGGDGETQQWVISATQDAQDPYGTVYAPFVILGHRTRGAGASEKWHASVTAKPVATESNQGYVEADPYPERALAAAWPDIEAQLDLMARSIAEETVRYITTGEGL